MEVTIKRLLPLLPLFLFSEYTLAMSFGPNDALPFPIKDKIENSFILGMDSVQAKDELTLLLSDIKDEQDPALDQLKGCASKTVCTGSGKDRTCETWEVCVSSD